MPLVKMVGYATIEIQISAPEDEVIGPNELALSDQVHEIEQDLGNWLNERVQGTKFMAMISEDVGSW